MNDRRRILLLIPIIFAVALGAAGLGIYVLYEVAFREERSRLGKIMRSQARLIEAVARFDAEHSAQNHPQGAFGATLSQIIDFHKHYRGISKTGEFALAQRVDDNIVFLLERRHEDQPHPDVIPLGSNLAEPMSLALMGQSGTMLGHGYRAEVRIVVWQGPDVLKLPLSALFHDGEAWVSAPAVVLAAALNLQKRED